jgi:putative transposase
MKSITLAEFMILLGVTKSHSRPYVSNDNPFSESQFRTIKYRPQFPDRFGSLEEARLTVRDLITWYNTEHYHAGIALLTPESVHYGRAEEIIAKRTLRLTAAYAAHPQRFVNKPPTPPALPTAVYINPPLVAPFVKPDPVVKVP